VNMRTIFGMLGVALLSAGCMTTQSGGSYGRSEARSEMTVRQGVVDSVRQVMIEGTQSPVGAGAGAVVGGIAGSHIGKGKGSTVGAVLGAVAGGVAGGLLEEQVTKKAGVEITVKLDNGQLIAITQAADEEQFRSGERVRILSGQGNSRVSH